MKDVIKRFIGSNSPKISRYLQGISSDNKGVARRGKLADKIESSVVPQYRRLFRTETGKLHPDLVKLESIYNDRIGWPKSVWIFKDFRQTLSRFERDLREPKYGIQQDTQFDECWKRSDAYGFSTKDIDLSKGSGLPEMGPKRDQLEPARQYAELIKRDQSTPAYMILPGGRTQQAPPGESKSRPIWGDPISEWVLEQEAFRDGIMKTVAHAKAKPKSQVAYTDHETLWKYIFSRDWNTAVVLDATTFDSSVSASEMEEALRYLAPNYEAIDHIIDHAIRAPVLLIDGPMERYGGMPSGKVFTNIVDGMVNQKDIDYCLLKLKLDRYVTGKIFNGDDILELFSTVITEQNVTNIAKISTRELNVDKTWMSTSGVWFSKMFYCEEYYCKPVNLVLNSTIFKENEADPLSGSRGDVAVQLAQQLEYLKHHPFGEQVAKWIKAVDKYPIEAQDDSIIKPAIQRYVAKHNWMNETGQIEEVANLQSGFYATV